MAQSTIGGTVSGSSKGGVDIDVQAMTKVGDEKLGAAAGVFAKGNERHGPLTTGAFGELNFKKDKHAVDLNAFHSHTKLQNGTKFEKVGANAAWSHAQGHSASLGVTQIPKFGVTTMNATGSANVWTSSNQASSLNMNAFGNQHIGGPFRGQRDFGGGLQFSHKF